MTRPPLRLPRLALDRSGDPYVWHFALCRSDQPAAAGERLATWVLPPELAAKVDAAALDRSLELERQRWTRAAIANGYVDGWRVLVHAERGFRRSIFPGAAVAGITPASSSQLVTPGGRLS